ncbi:histidine kinase [Lentimicrobium sp. L6]|uniref:sensor histidine kinase n=1 Tax=Lentimicrobium sp. L6 TaxID=2735916 RepID=UPI00155322B9|nr:histidine kinase [Lentimicrobium sp. L6]NPD83518.1 histidine kinase [Lentimicrobium sp. L6]
MEKIDFKNKAFLFHVIFWLGFWLIEVVRGEEDETLFEIMMYSAVSVLTIATVVTLNTKVLIPRFLYKGQYVIYFALLLLVVSPIFSILYYFDEIPLNHILPEVIENLVYIAGLSSVWLILDQLRLREELAVKEKENIAANLKFLKAQTNPHFLFNVLNNINFLIEKDGEKAQEVLQLLSDLLRYQLYETNTEMIALEKEINHLQNYLELEKLRMGDRLQLNSEFPQLMNSYNIAPFLLLPIIENSFKHGASADKCIINISCTLNNNRLNLKVSNPMSTIESAKNNGGIGIQNLKQRLELIYPNQYVYEYKEEDGLFNVHLILDL